MKTCNFLILFAYIGGGGGIRTPGGVTPTTVFETAPFNHSGTSPTLLLTNLYLFRSPNKVTFCELLCNFRILPYIVIAQAYAL